MPLFPFKWKGIYNTTPCDFLNHQFLIGGCCISNQFSKTFQSLEIEFYEKVIIGTPYVAQYIRPKMKFKVKPTIADQKDFIFDESEADLNKFD